MSNKRLLWVALTPFLLSVPAHAQGMMEFGGVNTISPAGAAGLGAGAAASMNHGNVMKKTFGAAVQVQQSVAEQTRAIEQQIKTGCELEAKKQWEAAEKAYTSALAMIVRRDGPKSPQQVPILHKLVNVCQQGKNMYQAISFQKNIVDFAKTSNNKDPQVVATAQIKLSDLYMASKDYSSAEPLLRDSLAMFDAYPTMSRAARLKARKDYAITLRAHFKDAEADAIEAEDAKELAETKQTEEATTKKTTASTIHSTPAVAPSKQQQPVVKRVTNTNGTSVVNTTTASPSSAASSVSTTATSSTTVTSTSSDSTGATSATSMSTQSSSTTTTSAAPTAPGTTSIAAPDENLSTAPVAATTASTTQLTPESGSAINSASVTNSGASTVDTSASLSTTATPSGSPVPSDVAVSPTVSPTATESTPTNTMPSATADVTSAPAASAESKVSSVSKMESAVQAAPADTIKAPSAETPADNAQ